MKRYTVEQEKIIEAIKEAGIKLYRQVSDVDSIKAFVTDKEFFYSTHFEFEPLLQLTKNQITLSIFREVTDTGNQNMDSSQINLKAA